MIRSNKKIFTWTGMAAVALLIVAGTVLAFSPPDFNGSSKVKPVNGAVAIPAAQVSDGKAHFYKYADAGKSWNTMLYGAGMKQGDPDWVRFVNTTFDIAIFGHQNELYDAAARDYFGAEPPVRQPGLPRF